MGINNQVKFLVEADWQPGMTRGQSLYRLYQLFYIIRARTHP